MPKYKIKHTSIMHNGILYSEGSEIELTENQAKRLFDFLELIPDEKKKVEIKTETENKTKKPTSKTAKAEEKAETKNKTETSNADGGNE